MEHSPIYLTYEDRWINSGAIYLRAEQIIPKLACSRPVYSRPISALSNTTNSIIIIIKPKLVLVNSLFNRTIKKLQRGNNKIILDVVDNIDSIEPIDNNPIVRRIKQHQSHSIVKNIDSAIFCSEKARQRFQHIFKRPQECVTLYHHWDERLRLAPPAQQDKIRIGYFGIDWKAYSYGHIPGIDFFSLTKPSDLPSIEFSKYNVHYIIKPDTFRCRYEPLTKIATAAAVGAVVISTKEQSEELLGPDYPYYSDEITIPDILKVIDKVHNTFRKEEWKQAMSIMTSVKYNTSLDTIAARYSKYLARIER